MDAKPLGFNIGPLACDFRETEDVMIQFSGSCKWVGGGNTVKPRNIYSNMVCQRHNCIQAQSGTRKQQQEQQQHTQSGNQKILHGMCWEKQSHLDRLSASSFHITMGLGLEYFLTKI